MSLDCSNSAEDCTVDVMPCLLSERPCLLFPHCLLMFLCFCLLWFHFSLYLSVSWLLAFCFAAFICLYIELCFGLFLFPCFPCWSPTEFSGTAVQIHNESFVVMPSYVEWLQSKAHRNQHVWPEVTPHRISLLTGVLLLYFFLKKKMGHNATAG